MRLLLAWSAAITILVLLFSTLAMAGVGADEYARYCSACHGPGGRGDGPIANVMKIPVADLTGISRRRDGEFPMLDVLMIIDGRTGIRGHGYPMPVWGDRFMAEAEDNTGRYSTELLVRGRTLSLAYYLQSIQK